jgi:flagellar assembly factor FliW
MHEATTATATEIGVVIHTPDGIPGFAESRHWSYERDDDTGMFAILRNLDQPGVGLMVTEPWDLAPGYEPDLPDDELERIGVLDASDITVLVVATIAAAPAHPAVDATAAPAGDSAAAPARIWLNLAAPITINVRTNQARQVILDRQGWPLRHPVSARA